MYLTIRPKLRFPSESEGFPSVDPLRGATPIDTYLEHAEQGRGTYAAAAQRNGTIEMEADHEAAD